jgi:CNT family concentrative nucleoside transporter
MNGHVDVVSSVPRRTEATDYSILTAAAILAIVAGVAAQLGIGRAQPIVGAVVILGLAYLFSTDRRAIDLRTVVVGLGLQAVFALVVLKTTAGAEVFSTLGNGFNRLVSFANVGSTFVFGPLADVAQWGRITQVLGPGASGVIIAFQVLPIIIFVAALMAILYHVGIMQIIVRLFAVLMRRIMHASGAESLNIAASIFMGMTEAPLTIRPYLPELTESELMTIMTCGMAHVSGGMMAAYMLFGVEAKHLLAAVIMTAPGTLVIAKMLVPETAVPKTLGSVELRTERTDINVIDAAARGTIEGLGLALNVGAVLISFIALIALLNAILGLAGLSLQQMFGWVLAPVAWSMGVPWRDAPQIGSLLGTRMALNEFVAYSQLGPLKASLDPKSFTIATFALCGFANFGSIGIQIGGIGALAPNRRHDLARLGMRAMLAGTLANFMTATIAGFLLYTLRAVGYFEDVQAAADVVGGPLGESPAMAIVLGSGLGDVAGRLERPIAFDYADLPHWPVSRVPGHEGRLLVGHMGGKRVVLLSGRCHVYEGHSLQRVTFAVRVMGRLGVKTLVLTNAAGGINTSFTPGSLMVIDDHLNLMGGNPLVGPNDDRFGPRFPDMSSVYTERLARAAEQAGRAVHVPLVHGVYAALAGPSYETPAEIRYLRAIGADAVGMSTVPEAIVARHMGIDVLGISCITNMAAGVVRGVLTHAEVVETSRRAQEPLASLLEEIVRVL